MYNCHNVRLRYMGPHLFVDAHVLVDGDQPLQKAHAITEAIEEAIRNIAPDADITVHPEPAAAENRLVLVDTHKAGVEIINHE